MTEQLPAREFWKRLTWHPAYGECFQCSVYGDARPARYEAWFTTSGPMVDDDYPPESCCHTLCAECLAATQEERTVRGNAGGREIVLIRPLRWAA